MSKSSRSSDLAMNLINSSSCMLNLVQCIDLDQLFKTVSAAVLISDVEQPATSCLLFFLIMFMFLLLVDF